jgi:hypothetical protein
VPAEIPPGDEEIVFEHRSPKSFVRGPKS